MREALKWIVLVAVLSCPALAQFGGKTLIVFPGVPSGSCGDGQLAKNQATGDLYSCGPGSAWLKIGPSAAAGNPGGSANQIQFNSGGVSFGGFTMSQDCTLVVGTGVITCTKTNNVAFGTFATQNFATPPAIGGTTPAAGSFTTLTLTTPLAVASGGSGTATPSLVGGTNITIGGSWPNQTVTATGSGSGTLTSSGPPVANQVPYFTTGTNLAAFTIGLDQYYSGTATTPTARELPKVNMADFYTGTSNDFCASLSTIGATYGSGVAIDTSALTKSGKTIAFCNSDPFASLANNFQMKITWACGLEVRISKTWHTANAGALQIDGCGKNNAADGADATAGLGSVIAACADPLGCGPNLYPPFPNDVTHAVAGTAFAVGPPAVQKTIYKTGTCAFTNNSKTVTCSGATLDANTMTGGWIFPTCTDVDAPTGCTTASPYTGSGPINAVMQNTATGNCRGYIDSISGSTITLDQNINKVNSQGGQCTIPLFSDGSAGSGKQLNFILVPPNANVMVAFGFGPGVNPSISNFGTQWKNVNFDLEGLQDGLGGLLMGAQELTTLDGISVSFNSLNQNPAGCTSVTPCLGFGGDPIGGIMADASYTETGIPKAMVHGTIRDFRAHKGTGTNGTGVGFIYQGYDQVDAQVGYGLGWGNFLTIDGVSTSKLKDGVYIDGTGGGIFNVSAFENVTGCGVHLGENNDTMVHIGGNVHMANSVSGATGVCLDTHSVSSSFEIASSTVNGTNLFVDTPNSITVTADGSDANCCAGPYSQKRAYQGTADVWNTGGVVATGPSTFSAAGVASRSTILVNGNPFAGTSTNSFPLVNLTPAGITPAAIWNTNGTYFGGNLGASFVGNVFDFHKNSGSSLFEVDYLGNLSVLGALSSGGATNNCGSSSPCLGGVEGSTEPTPGATLDFLHYNSTKHCVEVSVNGSALECLPSLNGSFTANGLVATNAQQGSGSAWDMKQASAHNVAVPLNCNATGSGTVQACTTVPTFTPVAKDCVILNVDTSNTGSMTLEVNSTGAKTIKKWLGASALTATPGPDLPANTPITACLDTGGFWEVATIGNAPAGTGSVTSVDLNINSGLSSGIFSGITGRPITGAGTINIALTGTSGGHPYFSTANILSSTTAQTAHGVWLAQGAGNADTSTAVGATNTVLHGNTGADPTFSALVTTDFTTAVNTRTATATDLAPVTGDDNLITILDPATAVHLTRMSCGVTGTTSVIVNLVDASGSLIADATCTAGTINQVVVTTWANGSAQCGGTSSCAVGAHVPVTIHIGTISGTPTGVSVALDYTVD